MGAKESKRFSARQLIELDACMRCGECLRVCDSFAVRGDQEITAGERIRLLKSRMGAAGPGFLSRDRATPAELIGRISKGSYECTLCGRCEEFCPVGIKLRDLLISMRTEAIAGGAAPSQVEQVCEIVSRSHNVVDNPNEDRAMWAEYLMDAPDDLYMRKKVDVLYFVGCMASFSPSIQDIPGAFVKVLEASGANFGILGPDEWCCGFPLIVAGLEREHEELRRHNLEKLKELGASEVVFSCPSCYYTWTRYYRPEGVRLMHATEFILSRIESGKIRPGRFEARATYHDPCDLGRGMRVFEPPREIIRSIPGLSLVELPENRERGFCCGGGGDIEMIDTKLVEEIASRLMGKVESVGAELVVTACQQCNRMIKNAARIGGKNIEVKDIVQLVAESLDA
jgi:heterodisulfide reductase subunit D